MPAGTKVAKAEAAIRKSASSKGMTGRQADAYVYGALNNEHLIRGNKPTKRGLKKALAGNPAPTNIVR